MSDKMTIDDIAEALGVSKTTVSRAISGKGRISQEMTERIRAYIEQHNYKPNAMARALANRQTYNIGVVWPGNGESVDLPFFQRVLVGMNRVTREQGYDILLTLQSGDDISDLKRMVGDHKIDGVILTRSLVHDHRATFLKESGIPFVVIGTAEEDWPQIDNDNLAACKELTATLLGRGMEKMALIGGNSNHTISGTRRQGFEEAFEATGREVDPSLIYMDTTDATLEAVLDQILDAYVDCVICMDDHLAEGVVNKCHAKGIHIPEQLRVASFYNSPVLDNMAPPVTSLMFDDEKLGEQAANALISMIGGNTPQNEKLRNYQIILRPSTSY